MSEAIPTRRTAASSAAGRMRLHRERRREGLRYVGILLSLRAIDELVNWGYLSRDERENDAALQKAVGELVAVALDLDQ